MQTKTRNETRNVKLYTCMSIESEERKKIYYALFFPVIICLLIILVFVFEQGMGLDFHEAGVFPRELKTLPHIFTMPFIHADWSHLLNNIVSFFVLSSCLYYFYSPIANKVILLSVILSGFLLWIIGRDNWHIGASGIIFALSFFLFFSGLLRKHVPLIAISFIVVFLYGNNVWHLFPWQKMDPVSWEGHLSGGIIGVLLAFIFRKKGPQKPVKIWEEDENADSQDEYWKNDIPEEEND